MVGIEVVVVVYVEVEVVVVVGVEVEVGVGVEVEVEVGVGVEVGVEVGVGVVLKQKGNSMITRKQAFITSNGKTFAELEDAQKEEVVCILAGSPEEANRSPELERMAHTIVEKQSLIVDILTTTSTSRPKARKANGATRKARSVADVNKWLQTSVTPKACLQKSQEKNPANQSAG